MNAPSRSSADNVSPGSNEQDAPASPAPPQGEREAFEGLSAKLWCDLRTDEERSAWLLLGRGYETGVVARALQNDLAMAYHRLALLSASLRASPAVPVAQDERALVAALEQIAKPGYGLELGASDDERAEYWHGQVEMCRRIARAALSAATPPAAVPMSQKTQDGHSTSRSGDAPTALLLEVLVNEICEQGRFLQSGQITETAFIRAVNRYADTLVAPHLKGAAGDQPSNGHGPESAAPQGFKLVPVEPTPEMCAAATEQGSYDNRRGSVTVASNIYRAMLTAAPQPAGTQSDLHAAILNLPCNPTQPKLRQADNYEVGYKFGHRDARHAAAELVAGTQSDTERDAARYRWVKQGGRNAAAYLAMTRNSDEWDDRIDAAMGNQSAAKEKGE